MKIDYVLSAHGYKINQKSKPASPDPGVDPEVPTDPEVPIEPEKPKSPYPIYGVAIDTTNPNPSTSVTYIDDAVGMVTGSAWDSIFPFSDIKPVLMNENGEYVADILVSDFEKKTDGNTASSGGNVMIRFPKIWYKIETIENTLYVRISTGQVDDSYVCYAFMTGGTVRNYLYVGAYLSKVLGGKAMSKSGVEPSTGMTLTSARNYARAAGYRYNLLGFHQITLLQILQLIRSKSLNSQNAYGFGRSTDDNYSNILGECDQAGMFYKSTNPDYATKVFGMEDFYGEKEIYIDGIMMDKNKNVYISTDPLTYTNSGKDYTQLTLHPDTSYFDRQFIKSVQGTSELGFLPKTGGGSETSYFCDSGGFSFTTDTDKFLVFGGGRGYGSSIGAFYLRFLSGISTNTASQRGMRIMCL